MAMYNAGRDDEHEGYEPEERRNIGTSFSQWWNNLRGRGGEEEYEPEMEHDPEPATATATLDGARSPVRTSQTGGFATAYNPRQSGGSQYMINNSSRRGETIRIAASREGSITVMPVTSFADIQKCADRLKSGEPQIVNLENTPPEVAERLIDFLNGVTYALDGFVEKVADGAYLFTPSHISIQTDGPEQPVKPFFDRG
ncbi:MAG: cell division protein SepF [Fibrella sp.]|nr:cell division protein SepF [Armatimonadota bacterium]